MRNLCLRDVPDDVVERLERLAARASTSLNALAVRELTEVSRRAGNAALLGDLPDHGIEADGILADLEAARPNR